jgi:hypothetical protein
MKDKKANVEKHEDLRWWRVFRRDVCTVPVYVSWRFMEFNRGLNTTHKTWKVMYVFGFRLAAWRVD